MGELNWAFFKLLRLELCLFVAKFSLTMKNATVTLLIQDKVCILERGYSREVCNNLHHEQFTKELESVLPDTNNYSMYLKLVLNAPSVLLLFFVGSWLDKHKKAVKLVLLLASLASALESALLLFGSLNFYSPVWIILAAGLSPAMTGGQLVRATTIVTQGTKETDRDLLSIRMAFMLFSLALGTSLASYAVGGFLLKTPFGNKAQLHNYSTIFIVSLVAEVFAIIWVAVTVRTTDNEHVQGNGVRSSRDGDVDDDPRSNTKKNAAGSSCCSSFVSLWDFRSITETCKIGFRRRSDYGRLKVWLLVVSSCIVVAIRLAPLDIAFQFTERTLGWDNERYNYVTSIVSIAAMPASLIGTLVVVRAFGCYDSTVGIIGSLSITVGLAVRGLVLTDSGYFVSYAISAFEGMSDVAAKSLIKPLVETNEVGRLLTFANVGNSVVQLTISPLMTEVFNKTLHVMPGFVFLFLSSTMLIPLIVFIFIRLMTESNPEKTVQNLPGSNGTSYDTKSA